MNISFLQSDLPVTKQYSLNPQTGELVKQPYPFVYEVTSETHDCPTLHDLYSQILKHSAQGDCLLKGQLNRELNYESRRGSTSSEDPTDWICLDLDGMNNYQSVDAFLLDIGIPDTDYILQWSSSMGVENPSNGFRCHVFIQLDRPVVPSLLKNWLMHLNLTRPTIASQLTLTKTGNALRWPLDITTCQNDKLLYISAPVFGKGVPDPYAKTPRISFEQRTKKTFAFPSALILPEAVRTKMNAKIAELREAAGMPKRKPLTIKYQGDIEYMAKPGEAIITEMKTERGFVYFNLNGGDSWGYFHPADNPEFIFNFKGEPAYRTEELLPSYWAKLTQKAASGTPDDDGNIYLAFRELTTGCYWNGFYNVHTDSVELYPAKSETQIRHFMLNHRIPMGETIPDWRMVFEPSNPSVIDREKQIVNTFNPSEFMKNLSPAPVSAPPPTIARVIDNAIGNDPLLVDHFYNWLACIVQYKTMTGTAWILHGTQGTGKGILMHKILTPILGFQNIAARRMEELDSQFTEFMENKFLVFIDEIESGKALYHAKITAKLKNLIAEPTISIRPMFRPAYMVKNLSSMIFASNKSAAVEVPPDDRRFNVGVYQENPLVISATEVEDIIPTELEDFYGFLMSYAADRERARTPMASQSRDTLIEINRTAIDTIADALLTGDLEALWDLLPSQKVINSGNAIIQAKAQGYKDLIVNFVQNLDRTISRDELFTIFEYTVGNMPTSPNKLTSMLKHHRLLLKTVWKHNRSVRGIEVDWAFDPVWHQSALNEIKAGVI